MKTIKLFTCLCMCLLSGVLYAQNGLEKIIVEKYYVANAADAAGSIGTLPVGSVTYRVWVDLLPGYKFQALYGVPNHELKIYSSTNFFNNEDYGAITPTGINSTNYRKNSVALDSWVSVGGVAGGNVGVFKSEDNDGSPGNAQSILQNNDPTTTGAINIGNAISATAKDGMIPGTPATITYVPSTLTTPLGVFGSTSLQGNSFSTLNGSIAVLGGTTGPTAANRVLIGQFTTKGVFGFELNIQVGTPTNGVQNFVAKNPVGNEIVLPSLTYVSSVNGGGLALPTGGNASNPSALVCSGTGTTITLTDYLGTIQWQSSSTPNGPWTSISGATNATYNTGNLTATTYYRAITNFGFADGASNVVSVFVSSTPVITFTNTTATTATLTWAPFASNTGATYSVTYSGAGSGTINNAVSPLTITGLNAGQTLNVTVNQTAPGACTVNANANVTLPCAAPVITSLTSTAAAPFGFELNWNAVPGATAYRIYYKTLSATNYLFTDVGNVTTKTVTPLIAGNMYVVYIAVKDCPSSGSFGQASAISYVTINPAPTCTPTPIIDPLLTTSNCSNQITISINPNGGSGPWRIYLRRLLPTASSPIEYNVSSTTVNLTLGSALSGSTYEVSARSVCPGPTYSAYATPVLVQIKPSCAAPTNFLLTSPTCNGFTATWNDDNCNTAQTYYLYIKRNSPNPQSGFNAYPQPNKNFGIINYLIPGNYDVFLRSVGCNSAVSASTSVVNITASGPGCRTEEVDPIEENNDNITATNSDMSMTLYPNPNNGEFNVLITSSNEEATPVMIEVINLMGQVVATSIAPEHSGISDIHISIPGGVASGVYILRARTNTTELTKKFIINR
jgi:hypothetical protein